MNLPQSILVTRTSGKKRGKKLGIPTINFIIPKKLQLSHGIYAGWVVLEKKYPAAIHFGPRPQFSENDPSLEAYLLGKSINIVSEKVTLEFVQFIRTVQTFPTVKDMLAQIQKDVAKIKISLSL